MKARFPLFAVLFALLAVTVPAPPGLAAAGARDDGASVNV